MSIPMMGIDYPIFQPMKGKHMAELKTQKNSLSVQAFVEAIDGDKKRQDFLTILEALKQACGAEPSMWGDSIVGLGDCRYKYPNGREIDWFQVGLASRKQDITLYFMGGLEPLKDLLPALGKYKTGKGCLYVHRVEEINLEILKKMATQVKNAQT
jgi:hypothetical protein